MKDISEIKEDLTVLFDKINQSIDKKYGRADISSLNFEENTPGKQIGEYVFTKNGKYCYGSIGDYGVYYEPEMVDAVDDLYFEVCWEVCSSISREYAYKNRVQRRDWRREAFPKRIELMENLGEEFGRRTRERIDAILKENPYDDKLLGRF